MKGKLVSLDDYRKEPVREYKKKYMASKELTGQAEAWSEMANNIGRIKSHLEMNGSVVVAIDALAELQGCCLACVERLI